MKGSSKFVDSYFISEYESGIFSIMFNTIDRWINYHAYCEEEYIFGEGLLEETIGGMRERIEKVDKFLPTNKTFIPTVIQNKDQITFYYIPLNMINRKAMVCRTIFTEDHH